MKIIPKFSIQLLLLLTTVVAAVVGAYRFWPMPAVVTNRVLLASTILTAEDVEVRNFPASKITTGMATDLDQVIGKRLKLIYGPNQILPLSHLEEVVQWKDMPATDHGLRVFSFSTNDEDLESEIEVGQRISLSKLGNEIYSSAMVYSVRESEIGLIVRDSSIDMLNILKSQPGFFEVGEPEVIDDSGSFSVPVFSKEFKKPPRPTILVSDSISLSIGDEVVGLEIDSLEPFNRVSISKSGKQIYSSIFVYRVDLENNVLKFFGNAEAVKMINDLKSEPGLFEVGEPKVFDDPPSDFFAPVLSR